MPEIIIPIHTVILTQTVGQVTDAISFTDFGTQTAQPKTHLSFARFLQKQTLNVPEPLVTIDDIISKNATILQAQIEEIQKIDEKLFAMSASNAPSAVADHSNNDVPSIVVHEENNQNPENVAKQDSTVDDNFDELHKPMASTDTINVRSSIAPPSALKRQQKLSIKTVSYMQIWFLISF